MVLVNSGDEEVAARLERLGCKIVAHIQRDNDRWHDLSQLELLLLPSPQLRQLADKIKELRA